MPVIQLESYDIIPVPNLQSYTAVSFLLLSFSLYHVFQVTSDPDWRVNNPLSNVRQNLASESELADSQVIDQHLLKTEQFNMMKWTSEEEKQQYIQAIESIISLPYLVRLLDMLLLMFREPLCFWTLINMAFCMLILVGKLVQKVVFGQLRVSEQQNIREKFWNFVFYKFIFIFGVLSVQYMDEMMLWCSWFSLLGFLSLLAQLCKDRFVYLSFSPTTPKWTHIRLLLLLVGILGASFGLFYVSVLVGRYAGISTFAIMAAECLLVSIRTLYVLVRYGIYLYDINHEGAWELRPVVYYYTEFVFEMVTLIIDFFNYLHMLFCGPYFLSLASLVIIMQLRFFYSEIKRRYRKHKNYLQVVRLMELNFPSASDEELEAYNDDCAICWEKMESARCLPCGHLFHYYCLRSWLEQDTSCPTCRTSLKNRTGESAPAARNADIPNQADNNNVEPTAANAARTDPAPANDANGMVRNLFYHFDGSRYASWLPSISVEVSRMNLSIGMITGNTSILNPPNAQPEEEPLSWAQLDEMAHQLLEWFPHMPLNLIMEDLRQTQSVNETVENILDGHLVAPIVEEPTVQINSPDSPTPSTSAGAIASETEVLKQELPTSSSSLSNESTCLATEEPKKDEEKPTISVPSNDYVDFSSKTYASDFAPNVKDREVKLNQRKEELLEAARKSFLARQTTKLSSESNSSNNQNN